MSVHFVHSSILLFMSVYFVVSDMPPFKQSSGSFQAITASDEQHDQSLKWVEFIINNY